MKYTQDAAKSNLQQSLVPFILMALMVICGAPPCNPRLIAYTLAPFAGPAQP